MWYQFNVTDWPSKFAPGRFICSATVHAFCASRSPFVPPRFPENLGEALELAKRHQGLTLALLLGILLYLAIAIYISLWVSRIITERLVKKSWCRGCRGCHGSTVRRTQWWRQNVSGCARGWSVCVGTLTYAARTDHTVAFACFVYSNTDYHISISRNGI